MQSRINQPGLLSVYATTKGTINRKAIRNTSAVKYTAFK
jgi:hypothetical protein